MAVNLHPPKNLLPVAGIRLAAAATGLRKDGRNDVAVIELASGTRSAAVFTRNAFCAAPVVVARDHLSTTAPQYLLFNSGNANAGTGAQGLQDAKNCCQALAAQAGVSADKVLPFSTGVIATALATDKVIAAADVAFQSLSEAAWLDAAVAIMTTDTIAKAVSAQVTAEGEQYTVTGFSKGSGMICPDMATMLSFIATDAPLSQASVDAIIHSSTELSFNSITVDGDTSTNDAYVLSATGNTEHLIEPDEAGFAEVQAAITAVATELAQAIVRDGEGATKFIPVIVDGAKSVEEARAVAQTVAHSPLVKTACFASDPNWGRILAAVGRAPVPDFDLSHVGIDLNDLPLVIAGQPNPNYQESVAADIMAAEEFEIRIHLGRGDSAATLFTCDFSYDYVRINAEYRS